MQKVLLHLLGHRHALSTGIMADDPAGLGGLSLWAYCFLWETGCLLTTSMYIDGSLLF